jgi:hypothetical protein
MDTFKNFCKYLFFIGDIMDYYAPIGREFHFVSKNKEVIGIASSLREFRDLLLELDISTIDFHLRNEKNDFEAWIRYALNLRDLADKVKLLKLNSKSLYGFRDELYNLITQVLEV